jgi:hypothetical protein
MNKKAVFGAIFTLGLAFGGLNSSHVSAVEIQPRNEVVTQPIELSDDVDSTTTDDYGVMPISETEGNSVDNNASDCAEGYVLSTAGTCVTPEEAKNILDEGTADEPLVVCTDESEPGCTNTDSNPEVVEENGDTVEVEPETWPLIVSLAALGATILFVIIINLFGQRDK